MAVAVYIMAALLIVPIFVVTTAAAFEEIIPIPQQMYDLSEESPSATKRFPDHFNNAPPFGFWFNVGECPETNDGVKQFYCASLTANKASVCIDDHQLCNGVKECPSAEDENPKYCLFYKVLKSSVQGLERDVQNLVRRHMRSPARRYPHGITHQEYH